jgi:hypothetical protein
MLHLLAIIFFSGAAMAALMLIFRLIGEEWDSVEQALGLAEPLPCSGEGRSPARRRDLDPGLRRGTQVRSTPPLRVAA